MDRQLDFVDYLVAQLEELANQEQQFIQREQWESALKTKQEWVRLDYALDSWIEVMSYQF